MIKIQIFIKWVHYIIHGIIHLQRSGKNRYIVLRWNRRINRVVTIVKEVSIGIAENFAKMLESNIDDIILKSHSAGYALVICST